MAIGTQRRVTYGKETSGWGAFYSTLNALAAPAATTVVIVGLGGSNYGSAPVTAGMYIYFLDDLTEAPKLISAVSNVGGNASCTVPALTNSQAAASRVAVDYKAGDKALLLNAFSHEKKMGKWSPMPFSGTVAKNVARKRGRIEVEGSMEFQLRPTVNSGMIAKSIGTDTNVTGTTPGTPVTTTTTGALSVGNTTVPLTSATGLAVNDVIQIGTGATAECRKILTLVSLNATVEALGYAHLSGAAVAKVIAPFIHTVNSRTNDLDPFVMEDYVPYDDATSNGTSTLNSYLLTGCKAKGVKFASQADQGINVTVDFAAQDQVTVPSLANLSIPSEDPMTFDQEAILISGTRNYRIEEISVEVSNDLQKRYTHNGSNRAFVIKGGQQEVKGSFKFYENDTTQQQFWSALEKDTQLSIAWTTTDDSGNYLTINVPKLIIDEFNDSSFSPADMIDNEVKFTAILDAGGTNQQIGLVFGNADYLPY